MLTHIIKRPPFTQHNEKVLIVCNTCHREDTRPYRSEYWNWTLYIWAFRLGICNVCEGEVWQNISDFSDLTVFSAYCLDDKEAKYTFDIYIYMKWSFIILKFPLHLFWVWGMTFMMALSTYINRDIFPFSFGFNVPKLRFSECNSHETSLFKEMEIPLPPDPLGFCS